MRYDFGLVDLCEILRSAGHFIERNGKLAYSHGDAVGPECVWKGSRGPWFVVEGSKALMDRLASHERAVTKHVGAFSLEVLWNKFGVGGTCHGI